jgi:hypothetical protein
MIATTISDTILYEEPNPYIVVFLSSLHFNYTKNLNKIKNKKFGERNNHIYNVFDEIFRKSKTFVDCKIKKNGSLEECDSVLNTSIEIINTEISKSKALRDSLKKEYNHTNANLIESSKIFNTFLLVFLIFSPKNLRTDSSFDTISKKFSTIDTSYWKQTPILKISGNSEEYSRKNLCFFISGNYLSTLQFVCLNEMEEYSISKKSFVFLETPYKSSCSYYDSSQTVFNSSSHKHCIRQCLRNYCEIKMNCSCFIFKDYDERIYEIISQSDRYSYDICLKDEKYMLSFYNNYSKFCTDLCPIDCKEEEFMITNKFKNKNAGNDSKIYNFILKWDDSKPLIVYRETPFITFTDYFCYIGSLFGMWFGISANHLFEKLIEKYRLYYKDFIHFSLILFYTSFEIIIFIKTKFLSIVRNF